MKNTYDFTVTALDGTDKPLRDYAGKVLLVINTASRCGLTPQLKDMQAIYEQYHLQGLEILAFPSNNFGGQEPLEGAAIAEFCEIGYRTTFPIFAKIDVIGKNRDPFFQFLSSRKENGKVNVSPKWNFQKYLINRKGEVIDYFLPITTLSSSSVQKKIESLLAEQI
jgi:glutathione peroxidase